MRRRKILPLLGLMAIPLASKTARAWRDMERWADVVARRGIKPE
jgi:hypothetical protein